MIALRLSDRVRNQTERRSIMLRIHEARRRHAHHYVQVAQASSDNYDTLREEYSQLRSAIEWLIMQSDAASASYLLDIIRAVTSYLLAISNNEELRVLCNNGQ